MDYPYPEKQVEVRKQTAQRPFLRARDTPPLAIALLYGFQQVMVCVSALLTVPIIMADSLCPGEDIGELFVFFVGSTQGLVSFFSSFFFEKFHKVSAKFI